MAADDLGRILERINYDPRAAVGGALDAESALRPEPIPWPAGLAPKLALLEADTSAPLPKVDALIVTYTAAEGQALADVLTPGTASSQWTPYRNGWAALKAKVGPRGPSHYSDCAGVWCVIEIGSTRVALFKSDLHPATDGPDLPMVDLWRQLVEQARPELIVTTGTAGGVGSGVELGDVVVAGQVQWNCKKQFAKETWAHAAYRCAHFADSAAHIALAESTLLPVNAAKIPNQYRTRPLKIITGDVETTDFFAFDDVADHYGLRAYDPAAAAVEMDDAALGLAMTGWAGAVSWVSVRNASDPQMNDATLAAEDKDAANIYEKYGLVTSWGSAIACWALVAGIEP